ncbi:MAG: SPASM domain-containing protein [Thermoplasmatales archaeon]|nr:SPASM domain-containing protein [Thermoplasmatales archaeon]
MHTLNTASIGWNGNVYLCCNYGDIAGNINGKNFLEIWNSKKYDEFRRIINTDKMPEKCKNCTWVNR